MGSRHSGSPVGPLEIDGQGAVLDGSDAIPVTAWKYHGGDVFCFQPVRLGTQQLFAAGLPAVRHPARPGDVTLPALLPGEWCLWSSQIFFRVDPGQLPDAYELSCCRLGSGITLYSVRDVVIRDLTVQGFHADGISAWDVVGDALFERVTCRGNGRSGVSVSGASRVDLNRCVLGDNGQAQLRIDGQSHTRLDDCELVEQHRPGGRRPLGASDDQRPAAGGRLIGVYLYL